jgi:excisionase family DNA binding protein
MDNEIVDNNTSIILLKPMDLAKRLNISRAMAYKLLTLGELPCVRIGRAVRVREADLESYIQKRWSGWRQSAN